MTVSHAIAQLNVSQIQAISLDLDDTLWPVWPTIRKAEAALLAWMQQFAPATAIYWQQEGVAQTIREQVKAEFVAQAHDFSFLRKQMIARALSLAGDDESLAEQGFATFFAVRQQVDLFPEVEQALVALSRRFPLVALSNGNANVLDMPIGQYFAASVPAREAGVLKPDGRIFEMAARRVGVQPSQVLHVGDDPVLDVVGALQAGMQASWLNRERQDWRHPHIVPHQIADLDSLRQLVCG
ncbi:HAD family hydrolase [Lampropedia puyangensis]|uniref:HAD family hydrolase n=2 Tax=Lampropedia puyangensis TaxID=1330072 RepID=A0A4S8FAJ3_9BURK|nr:HAD family hydrolase [Lampropedia puyangensis]